jgi:hypothetical protein
MLATNKQFTPQSAASVLSHELYHTKQPAGTSAYQGSRSGLQDFQQNLTSVLPHLQSTYGYSGAYDNMPLNKVPLNERMADLQSFQFNQGIDFAKDPVFQQKVLQDPYARAAYNASTIERTTRLDPRDLPPGVVTSSDFGPGGPPLMWNIENKLKSLLPAPRRFAEGGLAEADDMSRPFVGYRSAGRRPESQQDRRAAADAPLAALRGMVSGALGAPGDIESLIRMLPGLNEQTVLPTSEDVRGRLPGRSLESTPVGRAATELGTLGGGFYVGPGSPLRAIAGLPSAVSRAGRDFAMAAGQPSVNVVKPKGGNWLAGSVERAVEPMRRHKNPEEALAEIERVFQIGAPTETVELLKAQQPRLNSEAAMNRWLETKLAKYIRNEMATPEDPLRALAERGVSHISADELERAGSWVPENLGPRRKAAGFPEEGMATGDVARGWELIADEAIQNLPASERLRFMGDTPYRQQIEENPWIKKVPPDTMTYGAYPVEVRSDLGFDHLVDELRNAVNPESGLPANLRLKYSDLEKVTVPQAVERVAKINEWRAAQKVEADMARAMNPATQVVKEYPEQGYKWVELRQPEMKEMPPGYSVKPMDKDGWFAVYGPDGRSTGAVGKSPDEAIANQEFGRQSLEDALKYEGETMGHCVGGYCPNVIEGRSRIYSLRDKKGQPHVTIEVAPRNITVEEAIKMARDEGLPEKGMETFNRVSEIMGSGDFMRQDIVQIKGKGNKAPKDEYLPAVQDFVRSGNFGRIGDLQNTGLGQLPDKRLITKEQFEEGVQRLTGEDGGPGSEWFMNVMRGDPSWWEESKGAFEGFSRGGQVRGYAAGGVVRKGVRSLAKMFEEYTAPAAAGKKSVPGSHVGLLNQWLTEQPQDAITAINRNVLSRKSGASHDYELRMMPVESVKPTQAGEDYLNDSSRYTAKELKTKDIYNIHRTNDALPIILDEAGNIADGNHRHAAAVLNGEKVIPALVPIGKGSGKVINLMRDEAPGFATGGLVANFPTDDFDPDRIDSIVAELHAMNAA